MKKRLFTSESVTEGHPDKICDKVSDAVLDEILRQDKMARVACETSCTTGMVMLMGEITTVAHVDYQLLCAILRRIGYDCRIRLDCESCAVIVSLHEQSPDIASTARTRPESAGTATDLTSGGRPGHDVRLACTETPELMPLPISLAHRLARRLLRKNGRSPTCGLTGSHSYGRVY